MKSFNEYLLEQVELIENEFNDIDFDTLFNKVWDLIEKIGLETYDKMCNFDKFDYLVDNIIEL